MKHLVPILFCIVIVGNVAAAPSPKPGSVIEQKQARIDSLQEALISAQPEQKARIHKRLCLAYRTLPDSCAVHARILIELAQRSGDRDLEGDGHYWLGDSFRSHGDLEMGLKELNKALAIMKELSDTAKMADCLNIKGVLLQTKGDYAVSTQVLLESVRLFEALRDTSGLLNPLTNLAIGYFYQREPNRSLESFKRLLILCKELNRPTLLAINHVNIASIYVKLDLPDTALVHQKQAMEIYEDLGMTDKQGMLLNNMATIYYQLGKKELTAEYLERAIQVAEQRNEKTELAFMLNNVGETYREALMFDKAEENFSRALETALQSGAKEIAASSYELLSTLMENTLQYERAYNYYRQHTMLKDTLWNEDKSKEIGKLEAKHEFESAEMERKRAEEEQRIKEAAAQSRRDNLQYSGILIFLVLVFAGVFALGRFSIPIRLAEGLIFFSFLLLFEFTLVLLDPYIDAYSSGAPAIKLGFNALLAAMIFPLHSFFENKLKSKLAKPNETTTNIF